MAPLLLMLFALSAPAGETRPDDAGVGPDNFRDGGRYAAQNTHGDYVRPEVDPQTATGS